MNCQDCRQRMIDVLYGEELEPRVSYQFFQHLESCGECDEEYLELLATREMLGQWELEDLKPSPDWGNVGMKDKWFQSWIRPWWPLAQRIAAAFLILIGAASILQGMGFLGGRKMMVSERQLMEMVNDMVVARQAEEQRIIGQALVNFSDDMTLRQSSDKREITNTLYLLEQRYLENLEQNNQYLKALLSR
ncbi:MAG: anti-sigma factor family protein [Acidobacteriota bacterium]